jgi:integrase
MSRTTSRLTVKQVKVLRSKRGMHADGGGLYLAVSKGGSASWVYRYRPAGAVRERYKGLGPLHTITLAEAREAAHECRRLRLQGIDPLATRQTERAAVTPMTFKECAEAYIKAHSAGWKNQKHVAQWPSTLTAYVYPVFGDLPVGTIDVGLVMRSLEPIWNEKPETASRVRGRIESILDWATARGYRQGENPARWRGHLENLLPKKAKVRQVAHLAATPYPEIGTFMVKLRRQKGVAARALEFTVLTAARSGEVTGATWEEIDTKAQVWTVPASRMKAGRQHRVPLTGEAMIALGEPGSGLIFPNITDRALRDFLHRMGRTETVHGFRSAFSDWCAEQTNFPAEVREMALAHTVSDKVEAAYRRGDLFQKRRQLAEAWSRYCGAPAMPADNLVALRQAQA